MTTTAIIIRIITALKLGWRPPAKGKLEICNYKDRKKKSKLLCKEWRLRNKIMIILNQTIATLNSRNLICRVSDKQSERTLMWITWLGERAMTESSSRKLSIKANLNIKLQQV